MPRVVATKDFNKFLSELKKKGKKGKDAILKTKAAMSDAGMEGEITSVKLTGHGESRLPNIEKYDLGDGYRLVVQVIDPAEKQRAFLYVGDHDDATRWLENHKGYRWVQRASDLTLDFVQVTAPSMSPTLIPDFDLESSESLLDLALLRDLSADRMNAAGISEDLTQYMLSVTANNWEQDPYGIYTYIESLAGSDVVASLAIDLFELAHRREWDKVHRRLELQIGDGLLVDDFKVAEAMIAPENSERFVTWTDLAQLPANTDWADWMLFLHPEQKEFVEKSYSGPTRLRGVSGSGKTSVMIHRARQLAKRYRQPILLVTLTESMRKLLDLLVAQLCGAESMWIKTSTITSLAREVAVNSTPIGDSQFWNVGDTQKEPLLREALRTIRNHENFGDTVFSKFDEDALKQFIDEEIVYVRTRFLPNEYSTYLNMKRHGREVALLEKARAIILNLVTIWDESLFKLKTRDFEAIAQCALDHLSQTHDSTPKAIQYRCVLVDEVQDLSQIEMRILANIPDPLGNRVVDITDGMFLVGDGAQTVYRRGFTFKACGINIANRSFVLQKNYRNTLEIMKAAYGLIKSYEFADVDEENIQTPTAPHWSARHGERPFIVKCASASDESAFVVDMISEMMNERNANDDAEEVEKQTELPICVIGFNSFDRDRIQSALNSANIPTTVLRDDVSWQSNTIKISTLESAKGHEFHAVFIVGLVQGTMPLCTVPDNEWRREAARLYVGMTRARDRLFMSYVANTTGPSVFLSAIQNDCQECKYRNGQLVEAE